MEIITKVYDTRRIIRRRYWKKDGQYNVKKEKRTIRSTMIYKTLHRKLKIEQHEPHRKPWVNGGAPQG